MSVKPWNGVGQNQRVRIATVDPTSRKVEAVTKDGAIIQIAVWGQPTIFRWPEVGETWIVTRMSGYWILVEPVQREVEETHAIDALNAGDVNITTGTGGRFLVNGEPIGGGGGGGGGVFCVAGLSGTAPSIDLYTSGAPTYPAAPDRFPAQYFLFPVNYIAAQSGGFGTARGGSTPIAFGDWQLSVPEAGFYSVTMQCIYRDIEFTVPVAYGQINHYLYGGNGSVPPELTEGPLASDGWGDLVISTRPFFNSTSDDEASFDEASPEQGVPWINSFQVQSQGVVYLSPDIPYHTEVSFEGSTFVDGDILLGSEPSIIPGSYIVTLRKFG